MYKSERLVKITGSPFHSNLEAAGGVILKLAAPCSDKMVTVIINPFIRNYGQEFLKNVQLAVETVTDESKKIELDTASNKVKGFSLENKQFEIELKEIAKTSHNGQEYPVYHFMIRSIQIY